MANLWDGAVVFTAAPGTVSSADVNALQTQLATLLGPRDITVNLADGLADDLTAWVFMAANDPPYWDRPGSGAEYLIFPVNLHQYWEIQNVSVWCYGDTTGGELKLLERTLDTTPDTWATIDSVTNPWNTASAIIKQTMSAGTLPYVIGTTNEVAIRAVSHTSGAARVYGVSLAIKYYGP